MNVIFDMNTVCKQTYKFYVKYSWHVNDENLVKVQIFDTVGICPWWYYAQQQSTEQYNY
jgi:hypothetical protein